MAKLVTLLTQTTKWEVVKICTSPKKTFFCYRTEPIPLTGREEKKRKKREEKKKEEKKKKIGEKKVSLPRFEPGPMTLIDIGRYA